MPKSIRHCRTFLSSPLGPRQDLKYALDGHPFEGQAAGHDQADVARAEDDRLTTDPEVLQVDQILGRAGGEDPGRPRPRDLEHLPRPLAAAHGQDDGPGLDKLVPRPRVDAKDPVRRKVEDHGPGLDLDRLPDDVLGEAFSILGPADRLLIKEETEAVVDALVEDAAEGPLALDEKDLSRARPPGAEGRGQPGRPAADDGDIAGLDLDRHGQPFSLP